MGGHTRVSLYREMLVTLDFHLTGKSGGLPLA